MAEHHLIAFEIFLFQWIHERVSSLGNNETSGWATQTTTVQVGEGLLHIFVLNLFFFSFFFCNHHIDDSMDRYSYFIITHLIISLPNAISFQKLLAQQLGLTELSSHRVSLVFPHQHTHKVWCHHFANFSIQTFKPRHETETVAVRTCANFPNYGHLKPSEPCVQWKESKGVQRNSSWATQSRSFLQQ